MPRSFFSAEPDNLNRDNTFFSDFHRAQRPSLEVVLRVLGQHFNDEIMARINGIGSDPLATSVQGTSTVEPDLTGALTEIGIILTASQRLLQEYSLVLIDMLDLANPRPTGEEPAQAPAAAEENQEVDVLSHRR